ncbi:MAG: hypothetical protein H0W96_02135 [Solirubrobacterales bacterium]|nr:hypothetical protein [Solirubrobacterales bacterium]
MVVLAVAGVVLVGDDGEPGALPAGTHAVPESIPDNCSSNTQVALSNFINGLPEGSTVRFPSDACYAQSNRIEVRDKSRLTIDGNGSTFRSSSENTGRREANPNWLILRGRDVRITDMKVVGNFHLEGQRSQRRVNQVSTEGEAGATSQPNAGIGIYGGDGIHVTDMDIRDVFGDGVITGVSEYVDGSVASQTPRDVHVERVTATKTARHCFSPNQVIGFWLEDSTGRDCWYGALDAELDGAKQKLQDVHLLRNTFADFNMLGFTIPVAGDGDNTRDIEIRDNRFLTYPDQACNTIIEVGTYPMNPNTIKNVVVEGNSMKSHGVGVAFDHVEKGTIRDNRIAYTDVGCTRPKKTPPVRVTNSTGVTVTGNRRP